MRRRLALAALLLGAGCYRKRIIVVPPTDHGLLCQQDAYLQFQICHLQQRGWVRCEELRDMQLLLCPGAYELDSSAAADAGVSATGETPTYGLPGFRP